MHATWDTAVVGVATLVSIAAAVRVYAGRPRHPSNRLLAAGLFMQGLAEASIFLQGIYLVPPPQAHGIVTERERDILATLADRLGLSSVEALAVERSVQQGQGVER